MRSINSVFLFLMMLLAGFIGPAHVSAHGGAKGVVKERMEIMKSIAKDMKSVSKMARGKAPLDAEKIAKVASSIASHGERIPDLFPKGSGQGITEASPQIWTDPDGFKMSADRFIMAAQGLETAAKTNDVSAVKTAYRALGKTCSGCHKQFRIKK